MPKYVRLSVGKPQRVPGLVGTALKFAPRQCVLPGAPYEKLCGMDQLTVEFWFRTNRESVGRRQRIVLFWEHYLATLFEGGTIYGHVYDANGRMTRATSRTPIVPDVWYHVAVTYDGRFVRVLINGTEEVRRPMKGPVNAARAVTTQRLRG